jgi:hypothetical protein
MQIHDVVGEKGRALKWLVNCTNAHVNVTKCAYCGQYLISVCVNDVTGWIYTHKAKQKFTKSVLMLKSKNIMAFKMLPFFLAKSTRWSLTCKEGWTSLSKNVTHYACHMDHDQAVRMITWQHPSRGHLFFYPPPGDPTELDSSVGRTPGTIPRTQFMITPLWFYNNILNAMIFFDIFGERCPTLLAR